MKYLDLTGLQTFLEKLKELFISKSAVSAELSTAASEAANEAATDVLSKIGALIPTSMSIAYPHTVTLGNKTELYIKAQLTPASVYQNVLFLGDNKAVGVTPDGRLTVNEQGLSTIHIIPTANTALYRSIQIEVVNPTLRLINTRTQLHLLGNGNLLLN